MKIKTVTETKIIEVTKEVECFEVGELFEIIKDPKDHLLIGDKILILAENYPIYKIALFRNKEKIYHNVYELYNERLKNLELKKLAHYKELSFN